MTILVYANEQADDILSRTDTFLTGTLPLLEDDNIPLDDRWELYLRIEKLLPKSPYMTKAMHILTDSPYDDLYFERYETRSFSSIDQQLIENQSEDEDDDEYSARYRRLWEKRDAWREFVLSEGYGSFTFDW